MPTVKSGASPDSCLCWLLLTRARAIVTDIFLVPAFSVTIFPCFSWLSKHHLPTVCFLFWYVLLPYFQCFLPLKIEKCSKYFEKYMKSIHSMWISKMWLQGKRKPKVFAKQPSLFFCLCIIHLVCIILMSDLSVCRNMVLQYFKRKIGKVKNNSTLF